MKFKKSFLLLSIIILVIIIVACSNGDKIVDNNKGKVKSENQEKKTIKIGTTGYYKDVVFEAKKEFEKDSEYRLEVIVFDDVTTPNIALEEGSIDINFFQHVPYLEVYNKERGKSLVRYGNKGIVCINGIYSEKIESIEDIPNGAKVGISRDTSRRGKNLELLEETGLIKLKEGIEYPTVFDIIDNPKNLEIIEMDNSQIVNSLEDFDIATAGAVGMLQNGKDPKSAIVFEDIEVSREYADVLVIRDEDENMEWAKDLEDALTSEKVEKFINEELKGAYMIVK